MENDIEKTPDSELNKEKLVERIGRFLKANAANFRGEELSEEERMEIITRVLAENPELASLDEEKIITLTTRVMRDAVAKSVDKLTERAPEPVLSKEEVMEYIGSFAEKGTVVRELSDEVGLYLLEVHVAGEKEGEITEYEYTRKGRRQNGSIAPITSISVAYYEDGVPISGAGLANYDPETKEWKKLRDHEF